MWGQGHLCVCLKVFQVQKIDGTSQQRTNKPKFKKKEKKGKINLNNFLDFFFLLNFVMSSQIGDHSQKKIQI